jgi:hypothetical protein
MSPKTRKHVIKPEHHKKCEADALQNLYEAIKFNYDTHGCTFNLPSFSNKGRQARFEGHKVSQVELFHHIRLTS